MQGSATKTMDIDVRIKSKDLTIELESYILELKNNIETVDDINFWLNKINIVTAKLDQMHNGKLHLSMMNETN